MSWLRRRHNPEQVTRVELQKSLDIISGEVRASQARIARYEQVLESYLCPICKLRKAGRDPGTACWRFEACVVLEEARR